ncbi:MAG: HDOD domain-containing protein [Verrucomicrobia bacterium]|nr:HDOD domain-containing protein [Verrucomicrobiota bacterium]
MSIQRKLSILFVGKDPLIVRPPAGPISSTWENWQTHFAANAAEALERMASEQFDVTVSDLQLPGSDGIEFLKIVRERHPFTARIIYSSEAQLRLMPNAAEVADRCLIYPCSVEILIATISDVVANGPRLSTVDILERISKMEQIPSLPKLYRELMTQLQSLDAHVDDVSRTISEDIGMTTQILKLVNSAYFGLPQATSNVRDVIGFLGTETIKYLVLAIGIFRQFEPGRLCGFPLEELWTHSTRTALAAKLIAKSERAGRITIEHATTAGLLHDVGQIVLAVNYPEECREIRRRAQAKHVERRIEERAAFGFDHAEVGGCILGLWGLPAPLVEAVAFHHAPNESETGGFTPLTAVHAANVLVQNAGASHTGSALPEIDHAYLKRIDRASAFEKWREALGDALSA